MSAISASSIPPTCDHTHCHWFAGVGGFALGLEATRWPEHPETWTGGFPCIDISLAKQNAAGIDGAESSLWFEWLRLIEACRPARLLIENSPALRIRGADRMIGR